MKLFTYIGLIITLIITGCSQQNIDNNINTSNEIKSSEKNNELIQNYKDKEESNATNIQTIKKGEIEVEPKEILLKDSLGNSAILLPQDGASTNILIGKFFINEVCIKIDSEYSWPNDIIITSVNDLVEFPGDSIMCGTIDVIPNKILFKVSNSSEIKELKPQDGATINTLIGSHLQSKCIEGNFDNSNQLIIETINQIQENNSCK